MYFSVSYLVGLYGVCLFFFFYSLYRQYAHFSDRFFPFLYQLETSEEVGKISTADERTSFTGRLDEVNLSLR